MIALGRLHEPGFRSLVRPGVALTALAVTGQLVAFAGSVAVARLFGATAEIDAFIAANTLPAYVTGVMLASLGYVFIPSFVRYEAQGSPEDAWTVASGAINICALVLCGLAVGGMLFRESLTRLANPGLAPATSHLAARLTLVTWPTAVASGIVTLLASLHQANRRFILQALVPTLGAGCSLGLMFILAPRWGALGLAGAILAGTLVQLGLLLPILARSERYSPGLHLGHAGIRDLFKVFLPLLLGGVFSRWTPVVDRFIASNLQAGSIAHLDYALKLSAACILLISSALGTVLFPRMAADAARDLDSLGRTLSMGLRLTWLAIVPVTLIGLVVAGPLVTTVFVRGKFGPADAHDVRVLLQVYLFSVAGGCLGAITGRTLYVLRRTTLVAVVGIIQAIVYVVYASWFAQTLGVRGIAWANVLYFNASVAWQLVMLRRQLCGGRGLGVAPSFLRTTIAGACAAALSLGAIGLFIQPWAQVIGAVAVGLIGYGVLLLLMGSWEAEMLRGLLSSFRVPVRPPEPALAGTVE